jgi:hypothetical protein
MPKRVFTGTYTITYPEIMTPAGSLVGVPGEICELDSFPEDGRWAPVPRDKNAQPRTPPALVISSPPAPGPAEAATADATDTSEKVS